MNGSMDHGTNGSSANSSNGNSTGKFNIKDLTKWNVSHTLKWLRKSGFSDCERCFAEHKINGRALLMLDEDDLKEIVRDNVGQRKNLYHLIKTMQLRYRNYVHSSSFEEDDDDNDGNNKDENQQESDQSELVSSADDEADQDPLTSSDSSSNGEKKTKRRRGKQRPNVDDDEAKTSGDDGERILKNSSVIRHKLKLGSGLGLKNRGKPHRNQNYRRSSPHRTNNNSFHPNDELLSDKELLHMDHDLMDATHNLLAQDLCESCQKKIDYSIMNRSNGNAGHQSPLRSHRGEKRKTFFAVVYLFLTCLWTSFMLTVVHDRVPDMEKYPPLPDIILDNVPLIPWAFFATECIGLVLGLILVVILVCHKYRWIIFRRLCSLGSTIFFLRSITMLITSLSVPGIHIQCSSQRYGSFMNKINGAWTILSGVGLYVQGVRTCGDYMFSGHTVWLTLLTHFIGEYTPNSMNWLHTFTWVLNVFGLFFILGAHEHYSIDVFIAFYISSRLFLYYHSLANNKVLFQGDHRRVKIWFPLFSYFEGNIHSIVPNEFEWPPNLFYRAYRSVRGKLKRALNRTKGKTKNPLVSNLSCQKAT